MTRPLNTWRACGHPVSAVRQDRGCTCDKNDPTPWLVTQALTRLENDQEGDDAVTAPPPRVPGTAVQKP